MNIKILQENFARALTKTLRSIPTRPQIPILQNIKIIAAKDGIELIGTNTEISERVWTGGKVEKEGEACVAARTLFEFVSSLPPDTLQIVTKDESLFVSAGGFQASIPTVPSGEFPLLPAFDEKNAGSVEKDGMERALSSVLFSAAADEGRPLLTGVKVIVEDGMTTFVATDGYRLSLKRVALSAQNLSGVVVPARALSEVMKLSGEEKEEKIIRVGAAGEKQIGFVVGDTTLYTRLLDGEYPNFERIIPKTFTTRALIERELFLRAVRSAAIFARENANIIKLELDKQKITVSANAPQVGEDKVELGAKIDGDGGEIAFNSRFLIDFLTNLPDEEFVFEMTGALNSGVFKPVKDDTYLHIIMPVRVTS